MKRRKYCNTNEPRSRNTNPKKTRAARRTRPYQIGKDGDGIIHLRTADGSSQYIYRGRAYRPRSKYHPHHSIQERERRHFQHYGNLNTFKP